MMILASPSAHSESAPGWAAPEEEGSLGGGQDVTGPCSGQRATRVQQ